MVECASRLKQTKKRHLSRIGLGLLLLLGVSGLALLSLQLFRTHAQNPTSLLPGQQTWKQGVSSFLFGANDANWQWSNRNLGNTPEIVAAIKFAGITVIRSPLHTADAQVRVSAIEATGAQCLGVLDPQDAEQVVTLLGKRCQLYEFMNEPDNNGPSATEYARAWNQLIPRLRKIAPQAAFIGPVVAFPDLAYIRQFLTAAKSAGNLPDAVSYHMYPCTDQTIVSCQAHLADFGTAASQVRTTVQDVLGNDLPLCVTEYNYSWKPGQTPQKDPFMQQFTTQALQAMSQAGIVMANQFDIASNAGGGTLDLVDPQTAQPMPQLTAMQGLIQQYKPAVQGSPAGQDQPAQQPTVQSTTVAGTAQATGAMLGAKKITCPAAQNSQGTGATGTSNQPAAACVFIVQTKGAQALLLTWWNRGTGAPANIQLAASADSTNGQGGTWTGLQMSFTPDTTGGMQIVNLQGQPWLKVTIMAQGQAQVNGILEIYDATAMVSPAMGTTPSPTALSS